MPYRTRCGKGERRRRARTAAPARDLVCVCGRRKTDGERRRRARTAAPARDLVCVCGRRKTDGERRRRARTAAPARTWFCISCGCRRRMETVCVAPADAGDGRGSIAVAMTTADRRRWRSIAIVRLSPDDRERYQPFLPRRHPPPPKPGKPQPPPPDTPVSTLMTGGPAAANPPPPAITPPPPPPPNPPIIIMMSSSCVGSCWLFLFARSLIELVIDVSIVVS